MTPRNVPTSVYCAILQSMVTLSLAEIAVLAVLEELVTLLVQLPKPFTMPLTASFRDLARMRTPS